MGDDVKKIIYGVQIVFILIIVVWIGFLFVVGCNFSFDCRSYYDPPDITPIPTLIHAKMPTIEVGGSK